MPLRLVIRLDERTLRLPLQPGEQILGSSPECDVTVPHFTVSRRHAALQVGNDAIEIKDMGSRNGTTVDGQRIDRPVPVRPGQALAFGGAEAVLEHVSESDLEPAVQFPDAGEARDPASLDGDTPATSSLGAVKRFTLDRLPELLRALTDGASTAFMAQRVGASLLATVPCIGVEVIRRDEEEDAILFTGGTLHPERHAFEVGLLDGEWCIRVEFQSDPQQRGYAPLVEACAQLIELARGDDRAARPRSNVSTPPLPQPPTVVTSVQRLYADAARVARGDISVLIRGESGTGKEVLARYLHAASPRASESFVALNCAALPRDLLEAELFGVEKGAATGVEARPGKFELADGGTLFLDEIGDMAADTQARILRVLQEGEVFRLGGHRAYPARVRVVSATNRDLDGLLACGGFRSDLYHRIADWDLTLPTLRARRADIPNLAAYFLEREAIRHGVHATGISRATMDALISYRWPGNIRQLEREMARVVLFLEDGQLVERSQLQPAIRDAPTAPGTSLPEILEATERRTIVEAIEATDGDVPAAAKELGIGRSTLYRRIKELGILSSPMTTAEEAHP